VYVVANSCNNNISTFIVDSGASHHIVNDLSLLINPIPNKTSIRVGNGEILYAQQSGRYTQA
jgi:hypothetical protein